MKFCTLSVICAVTLMLSSFIPASPFLTKEAILIKATFFSHTDNNDKSRDTGIYLRLKTADGKNIIAHANCRDSSGADSTHYINYSNHQFDLDIDSPGMNQSLCKNFKVQIWQHTSAADTWKFHGKVVLYFSDSTNITVTKYGIELRNSNSSSDF